MTAPQEAGRYRAEMRATGGWWPGRSPGQRALPLLDELLRKILQDALAVALGAGWVVGFGYVVAEAADLVPVEVEIAALPALMGVVFLIVFVVGKIRYR